MEELSYFLGLQVKQTDEGILINQSKYIKNLFKKFQMQDSAPVATPIATTTKHDEKKRALVDETKYKEMTGSRTHGCISQQVDQISCLLPVFMPVSKLNQESHIWYQLKEFFAISKRHQIWDYGIQGNKIFLLLVIQM